jgi:hypothetical protein
MWVTVKKAPPHNELSRREWDDPGQLSFPDGIDLMLPGNVLPLHVDFASSEVHKGRP